MTWSGLRLVRVALVALLVVPSGVVAGGPAAADSTQWTAGGTAAQERTLTARRPQFTMRGTVTQADLTPWFTTRLKMRITIAPGAPDGRNARVIAAINDNPAALITLRAQPDGTRVFYDGYLSGPVTTVTEDDSIAVDYANYPRDGSVTAGVNTFRVALQDTDGLVERVEIDPASGFEATAIAPEQLSIALPRELRAEVGAEFTVPYEVSSRAERADRALSVLVEKAGGPLRFTRELDEFPTTGTRQAGRFTGVAAEPGRYELRVSANGGYNPAAGTVVVEVEPASRRGPGVAALVGALLLVGAAVILFTSGRRRLDRPRT
ncbi:hypothetical protein SAMN05421812_117121 [Asanoa hainanensis]|uniref:Ig-like domain (Group 3) n=1 Tax=Asanoa hainanensis TaxID=560556 RepID=A0A239PC99_9ACTN|nr:hypothetical protein [Asanoa hainanensis]SNT64592.1 hypothetical protein SAMN05421812_117121 [Asanoa hainanensis]